VQEGGCVKTTDSEYKPAAVPQRAKQAGDARPVNWQWVERSVWTQRMLEALEQGVKGEVWFSLIDKVVRPTTLYAGWETVKRNGGSAGCDHQSIEAFESNLAREIDRLCEELGTGTYQPRAIRRAYIAKPGSKEKRPLGIPCVRDRVVQAALRLVIEPIFEWEFAPQSYGFRPQRGCKDALRQVDRLLKAGYTYVVDTDLKSYFDTIPHGPLMAEIGKRIADGRVLGLIEAFLKQQIVEDMVHWSPEKGSPQGAVISPLLSNVYLHPVDVAMAKAGFNMIRYADDLVIMCRDQNQAQQALQWLEQLTTQRGLCLHPEKTCIVEMNAAGQGFDFLGYHFQGHSRWPRKKSLTKLKDTIRDKTRRCNAGSLAEIIQSVNKTLGGWFEYFKHSNKWTFPRIDQWIRQRLRSILRKRSKCKGISRGWDNQRWPNRYFWDNGLLCLVQAHQSVLQSLRR
jgi:RNA-directed DNA polymerase